MNEGTLRYMKCYIKGKIFYEKICYIERNERNEERYD